MDIQSGGPVSGVCPSLRSLKPPASPRNTPDTGHTRSRRLLARHDRRAHGTPTQRKPSPLNQTQGQPEQTIEPATHYRITPEDAEGPFVTIPSGMMQKASLPALGYTSLLEAITERFHSTPMFLRQLNPDARFAEGEEIGVPNVEPMVCRSCRPCSPSKSRRSNSLPQRPRP